MKNMDVGRTLLALVTLAPLAVFATRLTIPEGYDKNESPPGLDVIRVGFELLDISAIDETDFSIKVRPVSRKGDNVLMIIVYYFSQLVLNMYLSWSDSRLVISSNDTGGGESNWDSPAWTSLSPAEYKSIWKPRIAVENMRRTEYLMPAVENRYHRESDIIN